MRPNSTAHEQATQQCVHQGQRCSEPAPVPWVVSSLQPLEASFATVIATPHNNAQRPFTSSDYNERTSTRTSSSTSNMSNWGLERSPTLAAFTRDILQDPPIVPLSIPQRYLRPPLLT